jgi:hypothetical protein
VSEAEERFGARVRRLREAKEIGLRPFAKMIGWAIAEFGG